MLINEIVLVELKYDPELVSSKTSKLGGVDYQYDKTTRTFINQSTKEPVPVGSSLMKKLLKLPQNRNAIQTRFGKGGGPGKWVGRKLGMTGVGASVRGGQKSGILQKVGAMTGAVTGRALDNIAGATQRGVQNFRQGYRDAKDSQKGQDDANIGQYNFQTQKNWKQGEVDDREYLTPFQGKNVRMKNPNLGKTIGKDHYVYMPNKDKTDIVKTSELTKPGRKAYGHGGNQYVDKDTETRGKNDPHDDYKNLENLIKDGYLTVQDGKEIIQIANSGKMHLNKAYKVWQTEKNKADNVKSVKQVPA